MPEDDFDLDAWIDGTLRPTVSVEVYGKAGLKGRIQRLDADLRAATDPAQQRALAQQVEDLRADMEASRRVFTLAGIDDERVEAISKAHADDPDELAAPFAILAEQTVDPKLTVAQLRKLAAGLGTGYFAQTFLAASTQVQAGLGVTVPFSSAASQVLGRLTSGSS